MTPSFDQTLIARAATGLYNLQIGSATTDWALEWVNGGNGSVADLVNQLYVRDFAAMSDADVAAMVVANVNISEPADVVDAATAYVAQQLGTVAPDQKGAMVMTILQEFAGLASDPIYGSYATAFNAQIAAAVAYAQISDTPDVPLDQPESMAGKVFTLFATEAAGADVMRLTGDQDVRIDFTNPANQVTGLDLDGDGLIEFNGLERSITGVAADFEIVDAYARMPLNHLDTANNFLGDIYFDGTGFDGDGTSTDGNIFLGGLGVDNAFGGIGNDFMAGGGVAQGRGGFDAMRGGRNADFFFAEFSGIDATDGGQSLFIDGGNTADDSSAGTNQTPQDSDWLLLEASDDDEPVIVQLEETDSAQNDDSDVLSRSGEWMDIDDVENLDASGNLYGFLDDMDVEIGGRATDTRDVAGSTNYGLGSSAQLRIFGSEVANIVIAGYDNDFVDGGDGNDLLFGGNLQFLFETVEGGATNPNLAGITLNGRDELYGGNGNDSIVFEADSGVVDGGAGNDTLWLTNYHFGTSDAAAKTTDGVVRFDLLSQNIGNAAGYGGANVNGTQDQTNYAGAGRVTVTNMENVDATGLGGIDYLAAGTNDPELNFANQQNHWGYNGDLDLRGDHGANNLYAGNGDDVIEGRGGNDDLMGGNGIDDFYFSIDGDASGDDVDKIRRKVDADGDGLWDGTWGPDFGQLSDVVVGASALTVDFLTTDLSDVGVDVAVFDVTIGGVLFEGGTTAELAAATTTEELAAILNAAYNAQDANVSVIAVDNTVVVVDNAGRVIGQNIGEGTVVAGTATNGQLETLLSFGPAETSFSQDRLIYKAYEDRSDNEGVDDDAVTGSLISLGDRAYAEDLVVNFADDGTRIAEGQSYTLTFTNLTTEDTVTIKVNGVEYSLQVGVALNGTQEDDEDGVGESQSAIQSAFMSRMTAFINSFMDDDTAAGQVSATTNGTNTITLTQAAYDGEETVFMTTPTVTVGNQSGGEKATATVSNNASHEVLLFQYDGRDNGLNADNVLFWGQESVSRSILETADDAGGSLNGSHALVINGGDDDLDGIAHNLATDADDLDENFAVHGDDFLLGGAGDDVIHGLSGDDRIQGSLGNDELDGGGDWYFVRRVGETQGTATYLNAHEAMEVDADGDVLEISLIQQTEDNENMVGGADFVPYFRDTLVYAQADFTPGASRFTITLNDYEGTGDEIDFVNGGAGTVGVDADGDGVVEAANVSTFENFENIRTVSGVGKAVAGTGGGQGRDTLDVSALSTDAEVGVHYDMTGGEGMVSLIEDPDDDADTDNNVLRNVIEIDGVENVIFGLGDDILLIDETEAAKDNVVTGGLGDDLVVYSNDFGDADDEPTVTIVVESSSNTDQVVMTEGRVGDVVATDTLSSVEEITLDGNTAAGVREDDTINVEALAAGSTVNYITGEISDEDGDVVLTIGNIVQMEYVVADGDDTVIVADADDMEENDRADSDASDITFNSYLNYDLLDQRGDTPERLTISELRAIQGGTANTATEDDIPEAHNIGLFNFLLGQDTDRVDYSNDDDEVTAVVNFNEDDNTQYIFVDDESDGLLDDLTGDRIDRLVDVEEVVASQGGGILDLTNSTRDLAVTFSREITDVPSADRKEHRIQLSDLDTDQVISRNYIDYRDADADDDIDPFQTAYWATIEDGDNDIQIELTDAESMDEHNFNLRGGNNEVNYNELTRSIQAIIDVTEYDANDPVNTGLIEVDVSFTDGAGNPLGGDDDFIRSHSAGNAIAAGALRIEASQDAEDVVGFVADDLSKLFILGQVINSSDVITVEIIGDEANSIELTGFEGLADPTTDDVYQMDDLDRALDRLFLVDSLGDRDTIAVGDDAVDFEAAPNDTISLEVLNDEFGFDFDVLDITAVGENNLMVVGDTNVLRDTTATPIDGDADDVVVGDLGLIDSVTLFQDIWLTDASLDSAGTEYTLDITDGELEDEDGPLFTTDTTGLNFSLVSEGVTVTVRDLAGVGATIVGSAQDDSITGGAGNDVITGGGGDDTLDGGTATEVRTIQLDGLLDATNEAVTINLDGYVLTLNEVAAIADIDPSDGTLDVLAGVGSNVVGAALATLVNANLANINDGVRFGSTPIVNAAYDSTVSELTITFASGADVPNGDTIVVADTDGGTFAASAENVVDGGTGGADTFVFAATGAANGSDTISLIDASDTLDFSAYFTSYDGSTGYYNLGTFGGTWSGGNTQYVVYGYNKGSLSVADFDGSPMALADGARHVFITTADEGFAAAPVDPWKVYYVYDADPTGGVTPAVELVATIDQAVEYTLPNFAG
jgi:hypothetical protein